MDKDNVDWFPLTLHIAPFPGEVQLCIPPAVSQLKLRLPLSRFVNLTITAFWMKSNSLVFNRVRSFLDISPEILSRNEWYICQCKRLNLTHYRADFTLYHHLHRQRFASYHCLSLFVFALSLLPMWHFQFGSKTTNLTALMLTELLSTRKQFRIAYPKHYFLTYGN